MNLLSSMGQETKTEVHEPTDYFISRPENIVGDSHRRYIKA